MLQQRLVVLCVWLTGTFVCGSVIVAQKTGNFKDWNYSQSDVYGLVKMDNVSQRSYYAISRPDAATVKVQEYNSSGIPVSTTLIRFVNGKLNQVTRTDRWNDTYEISKFTVTAPNEFMVTRRSTGRNDYLPCKGAKYIYRNNLLAEIRYMSYANKITANTNGVAIIRYKRYEDKNRFSLLKEQAFFDENGLPVISRNSDCHKIVYEYDERCNQVLLSYYGTDNEPLTNRFGGFKIRSYYNGNDNLVRSEIIGINDELAVNTFGVCKTDYEYKDGRAIRQTRLDDKGNIVKASTVGDGVAIIKYEYDSKGNEISRSYFDEYNKPMNDVNGRHMTKYKYASTDMLTGVSYFDKSMSAVGDRDGIHRYEYTRDDKGRIITEAYFDAASTPLKDKHDEVYMMKRRYDEFGRELSRSFWENSSTKMVRWNGYHEQVNKYNEEGQVTEVVYLDDKGALFLSASGYSRFVNTYNTNARLLERKCFSGDTAVHVVNSFVQGYHVIRYTYDNNGRVASLQYFDRNKKPIDANIDLEGGLNFNKIEFIYKGNRIIEEKLYTANSDSPSKFIDCLKNDYVTTSGLNKGIKNQ
jgi:hypothetical protein